ncbi:protein LTO1 homolog [Teleopsis dalmanni]|uniref:protein LTO1 homolog n=1 Tax=Teleopsis dalmanni TaxID=139649 RepID=UPI0018CCBC8B|nr:protein LTO1 homolog [Teleopsis dalmanni]
MAGQVVERDINDIFDDIALVENNIANKSYHVGFEEGLTEGTKEGHALGYAHGIALGEEIGDMYGFVVAQLQFQHTSKIKRSLEHLRHAIDDFISNIDVNIDNKTALEQIRVQFRRLQVMSEIKSDCKIDKNTVDIRKDLSF